MSVSFSLPFGVRHVFLFHFLLLMLAISLEAKANTCPSIYQHSMKQLDSTENYNFCQQLNNKVVLFVNTASQCGFTPQFKQLEMLYQEYKNQGLMVVGFPSNDFMQDRGTEKQIAKVCYSNYGVTFPMMEKSKVLGKNANPIYKTLAIQSGKSVGWNFQKYLVNKKGEVVAVFPSNMSPIANDITSVIVAELNQ
ncbi:glutathione peroxidase [Photobacterium lucens]|uniref:glutathione peroxidase n=1 Tax=Photobacterium lucens TaxID=2562949 RepID=UPI0009BBC4C1|nr:glutathione peroxidase [Photobacterium lucens]MBP2700433.1 glutathione peroxidase [Vibrio parahaemolyticus]MZG56231.1 glutathione peroxidase [Photobacterium lucens]MZG80472.1 glutathione peroxidase [Photobacterium lucens]